MLNLKLRLSFPLVLPLGKKTCLKYWNMSSSKSLLSNLFSRVPTPFSVLVAMYFLYLPDQICNDTSTAIFLSFFTLVKTLEEWLLLTDDMIYTNSLTFSVLRNLWHNILASTKAIPFFQNHWLTLNGWICSKVKSYRYIKFPNFPKYFWVCVRLCGCVYVCVCLNMCLFDP